jgi:pyruvate dehydrogenase kinase 2/3/4
MPLTTTDNKYPENISEYNEKFTTLLEGIKKRHDPVVTSLAEGIIELKEHWKKINSPLLETRIKAQHPGIPLPTAIQAFLDRFYMSRIGIRMLIGQHVTLSRVALGSIKMPKDYVGIICTNTNVRHVAEDAIENAKFICQEHYGLWTPPPVKLFLEKENIHFSYVPSHLHHMLFELLKNSLRAVVDRYGVDYEDFPEIRIFVAEGKEDISIKVCDEGGGIPRSGMPLIWTYMYTTAQNPLLEPGRSQSDFRAPLAG